MKPGSKHFDGIVYPESKRFHPAQQAQPLFLYLPYAITPHLPFIRVRPLLEVPPGAPTDVVEGSMGVGEIPELLDERNFPENTPVLLH